MAIRVNLDVMLAKRKRRSNELATYLDMTEAAISILRSERAKAIRFSTLDGICRFLDCQPGDILEWVPDEPEEEEEDSAV